MSVSSSVLVSLTWNTEPFEENLHCLLTIAFRIERCLGDQDRMLFWRGVQLVVKDVVPDLLHVVPVGDNATLDRVSYGLNLAIGPGCTHSECILGRTHLAHGIRENSTRFILASEASLDYTRPVVDDNRLYFIVRHCPRSMKSRQIFATTGRLPSCIRWLTTGCHANQWQSTVIMTHIHGGMSFIKKKL